MKPLKAITTGSAVLALIPAVSAQGLISDGAEYLFGATTGGGIFIKVGLFIILFSFLMLGAKKAFPPEHQSAAMLVAFILALISMKFMPEPWIAGMGNVIWLAALALLPYAIVSIFIRDDTVVDEHGNKKLSKKKIIFTLLAYAVLIFSVLQMKNSPSWARSLGLSGGYLEVWEDTSYWVSQRWWLLLIIALVVLLIIYLISGSKGGGVGDKPAAEKGPGFFENWGKRREAKRQRKHELDMERLQNEKANMSDKEQRKILKEEARQQRKKDRQASRIRKREESIRKRREAWDRFRDLAGRGVKNGWEAVKGAGRKAVDVVSPERRLEREKLRAERQKSKLERERPKYERKIEKLRAAEEIARSKGKISKAERKLRKRAKLGDVEAREAIARETEERLGREKLERTLIEREKLARVERERLARQEMERRLATKALPEHGTPQREMEMAAAAEGQRRAAESRKASEEAVRRAQEERAPEAKKGWWQRIREREQLARKLRGVETAEEESRRKLQQREEELQAKRAAREAEAMREAAEIRVEAEREARVQETKREAQKNLEKAEKIQKRETRAAKRNEARARVASKRKK